MMSRYILCLCGRYKVPPPIKTETWRLGLLPFHTLTLYTPGKSTLLPIMVTFDNLETFVRVLKDQEAFDVCVLIL